MWTIAISFYPAESEGNVPLQHKTLYAKNELEVVRFVANALDNGDWTVTEIVIKGD